MHSAAYGFTQVPVGQASGVQTKINFLITGLAKLFTCLFIIPAHSSPILGELVEQLLPLLVRRTEFKFIKFAGVFYSSKQPVTHGVLQPNHARSAIPGLVRFAIRCQQFSKRVWKGENLKWVVAKPFWL